LNPFFPITHRLPTKCTREDEDHSKNAHFLLLLSKLTNSPFKRLLKHFDRGNVDQEDGQYPMPNLQ